MGRYSYPFMGISQPIDGFTSSRQSHLWVSMSDASKNFFANLRAIAADRGVASAPAIERATKKGVSRSAAGRYLAGEGNPTLEHMEALAKALNVEVYELLRDPSAKTSVDIRQAIGAIADALTALSPGAQRDAADLLQRIALVPEGKMPQEGLHNLLTNKDESGGGRIEERRAA